MKKWKIALPFCYLSVAAIGIVSYLYDLQIGSNDDFPLSHRLACTVIFCIFTLFQWLTFKRIIKKLPEWKEKRVKRAYTFLESLSILKVLISAGFDCFCLGGIAFILFFFSPFALLSGSSASSAFGAGFLSLIVTYLPWILFVGLLWLIERILLKKFFNVKRK